MFYEVRVIIYAVNKMRGGGKKESWRAKVHLRADLWKVHVDFDFFSFYSLQGHFMLAALKFGLKEARVREMTRVWARDRDLGSLMRAF